MSEIRKLFDDAIIYVWDNTEYNMKEYYISKNFNKIKEAILQANYKVNILSQMSQLDLTKIKLSDYFTQVLGPNRSVNIEKGSKYNLICPLIYNNGICEKVDTKDYRKGLYTVSVNNGFIFKQNEGFCKTESILVFELKDEDKYENVFDEINLILISIQLSNKVKQSSQRLSESELVKLLREYSDAKCVDHIYKLSLRDFYDAEVYIYM